jgi:ubiquinone/menaquinone biosynthesis C-methylase UbiE
VRPVLVEPEAGACRAAKRLFGYSVVCADGSKLPMTSASYDAAWCLGVLCTTSEQVALLEELRRVVRPGGPIGVLAFVAQREVPDDQLDGNHFPSPGSLLDLVRRSSLRVEHSLTTADLPAIPEAWNDRVETVTKALDERHGHTRAWQMAERQSAQIGRLLDDGTLTGELLVLRHA